MLIDSVSIILLTVPIFAPIAMTLGIDPLAFAIFGILVIEAGLLTPPFGLLVYTVKGAVPDNTATLSKIFAGSFPYFAGRAGTLGLKPRMTPNPEFIHEGRSPA